MQRGNDCAVRERELSFPERLDRNIVAQLGAQLFQVVSYQVGNGDHAPVAGSGRNCDAIDRGGITLSLWRALLALCGGSRDLKRPNARGGPNASSAKTLPNVQ